MGTLHANAPQLKELRINYSFSSIASAEEQQVVVGESAHHLRLLSMNLPNFWGGQIQRQVPNMFMREDRSNDLENIRQMIYVRWLSYIEKNIKTLQPLKCLEWILLQQKKIWFISATSNECNFQHEAPHNLQDGYLPRFYENMLNIFANNGVELKSAKLILRDDVQAKH